MLFLIYKKCTRNAAERKGTFLLNQQPLVFGIGQCSLDYLGLIDAYPPPDVKCEFSHLIVQGGGPAATALVALARWGCRGHLAGVVGDDAFGSQIRTFLSSEGIDITGLQIRPSKQSQFAFIVSEPSLARRTIFWQRPTGDPLLPEEINPDVLQKSAALHIDGLFPDACLFACQKARSAGIPVILDAGTLRDGMIDIAKESNCVITSEVFSKAFAESHQETCRKLVSMGVKLAGVTLGARGYVALADGRWIQKDAYPVKAIDTTGCGDVFHAGVTYGIVHSWSAEQSMDLGAWAAAAVSTQMGGRAGIPPLHELHHKYPMNF